MRHENVLRYFGAWCKLDTLYLGFEFADKGKLDEHLQQRQRHENSTSKMSSDQIKDILFQIVQGLAHLHSREIIHGNLRGRRNYIFLLTNLLSKRYLPDRRKRSKNRQSMQQSNKIRRPKFASMVGARSVRRWPEAFKRGRHLGAWSSYVGSLFIWWNTVQWCGLGWA